MFLRSAPLNKRRDTDGRRPGVLGRLGLWLGLGLGMSLGVGSTGCASFVENLRPVLFAKTAKENYERGIRAMKGDSHLDAAKYFNYIKQNFPTSRWVPWAELGLADAAFGRESYIEAIDDFQAFERSHPKHPRVLDGYCSYKIGEAYYKQIPSDWFLVPPSFEKDQGPVHDAKRELQAFLDRYGNSQYADKARKLFAEALQRLADNELYIARFYLGRNRPKAATWRLEYVVNEYPGARREAEVLLLLGQVLLKQENPQDARDAFRRLIIEHPKDYRCKQAQVYLDYIAERYPNLPTPAPLPPRKQPGQLKRLITPAGATPAGPAEEAEPAESAPETPPETPSQ